MPIVSVKMARGRTLTTKRELARRLTDLLAGILEVEPEWVTVLIEEYDREDWATGGQLHLDKFGRGYGKRGARLRAGS